MAFLESFLVFFLSFTLLGGVLAVINKGKNKK